LLNEIQLWRKSAENSLFPNRCLPAGPTRASVPPVASPSNNLLAANCQNRYPSPSKRSGQILVRPLNLSGSRHLIAQIADEPKITFALGAENRAIGDTEHRKKGKRACKIKFGRWLSQRLLHCRLAVKRHWNRDLWARAPARVLRSFSAVIRQPEHLSAAQAMCCSASKTRHSVDLKSISGAFLRRALKIRPFREPPGGRFCSGGCRDRIITGAAYV